MKCCDEAKSCMKKVRKLPENLSIDKIEKTGVSRFSGDGESHA